MECRLVKKIENNVFSIIFRLIFSTDESALIKKYSSPEINVGGNFSTFTLPDSYKKFIEFPYTCSFDGTSLGRDEALARSIVYIGILKIRLTDAWNAFKQNIDTFTGEDVFTV